MLHEYKKEYQNASLMNKQESETLLERVQMDGFRKYILPTEINKVDEDGVHLNVSREI